MKRFLLLVFFLLGALALLGFWWYQNVKPVSGTASYRDFLITKGSSASQIGQKLQKEELIRNALFFRFYAQLSGVAQKIKAGEYRLSPSFSLYKIVNELLRGPTEIWVTIPEGLRREEIAQKFATTLNKNQEFITEFLTASKEKEGYLFPDTYLFPKETTATKVVEKMLNTFAKKVDLKITDEDIILASLVERETRTVEERPAVAGILLKRLRIGMPLQVDATIQYTKGNWGNVLIDDKKIKSSYNTYTNRGLPPGPICNPGLSSIKAVIYPQASDYLYYLHDDKGVVHYAKTLEEHNANIGKYLGK